MDKRYMEYLQSDWWKKTREAAIKNAGNKCECCGRPFDLQVHHLTYEHLGFERDYELMCLCTNCHEWIEERKKKNENGWEMSLSPKEQRDLLKQHKHEIENNAKYVVKTRGEITSEFIADYYFQDYSQLGNLNLTKLDVIDSTFKKFCIDKGYDPETPCSTSVIQVYFSHRRYEVILRYIENGADKDIVISQTRISPTMIYKVFKDPNKYKNMLIKEELRNAETTRI